MANNKKTSEGIVEIVKEHKIMLICLLLLVVVAAVVTTQDPGPSGTSGLKANPPPAMNAGYNNSSIIDVTGVYIDLTNDGYQVYQMP